MQVGTGNHGCCLEKLTRKRRLVKHWCSYLPRAFTVMSFDFSSRFLYTPEASSPHMYLLLCIHTLLLGHLGFRQTAVVRSLSFTVSVFCSGLRNGRTTVGLRASASSWAGVRRPAGRSGASRRSRI